MYFEQFYPGRLAHASYMLGSEGEAAVVDPQRNVELYLTAAAEKRCPKVQVCNQVLLMLYQASNAETQYL